MGPQGCGKSTLAKIISFCSWLEKDSDATGKAEARGLVNLMMKFHRMEGYFHEDSELAYIGDDVAFFYRFHEPLPPNWNSNEYNISHFHEDEFIFHKVQRSVNPKVIYIPAERNFVSVVPNLQKYAEHDDSLQNFPPVFIQISGIQLLCQNANVIYRIEGHLPFVLCTRTNGVNMQINFITRLYYLHKSPYSTPSALNTASSAL